MRGLLRSVVVNLIDNAAEALEDCGGSRNHWFPRSAHGDAETVEIVVQDTGHGISPEDKDRLFLPHFSTKDRGTGLGLAIAARIVAEHGGTIHVEDNFPVGSRFVVELPSAEPAAAAGDASATELKLLMTTRPQLLVVDDEDGIRESLSSILRRRGLSRRAVGSAKMRWSARRPATSKLMLLDVWLPGIDGLEALSRLQAAPRPPAVIMISGHGTIETAVRATKLGAFDFIEKPLSLEKIIVLVRNAIQQRRLQEENQHLRSGTRPSLSNHRRKRADESAAPADCA